MISSTLSSKSKLSSELSQLNTEVTNILVGSINGIVSGLEVSAVGLSLQVSPGEVVVDGSYCKFVDITDGIQVNLVSGERGFLVVRKFELVETNTDPYGVSRITGTKLAFEIQTTTEVLEKDVVLAHYEITSENDDDGTSLSLVDSEDAYVLGVVPTTGPFVIPTNFNNLTSAYVVGIPSYAYELTYVPSDPNIDEFTFNANTGVVRFSSANAGLPVVITTRSLKPTKSLRLVVDTSKEHYASVRPMFTMKDTQHCVETSNMASNPHGTTFDDMSQELPLHSQIFDTGFSVTTQTDRDGIPGKLYREVHTPYAYVSGLTTRYRFQLDMFGEVTGTVGKQFIRLKHTPLVVSYVVEKVSRRAVSFQLVDNVLVFPQTSEYNAVQLEVGYTAIAHLDSNSSDNAIVFNGGSDIVAISEGHEVKCDEDLRADFGPYKDIPTTIVVAVDHKKTLVTMPSVLDQAVLSNKTSSEFSGSVSVGGQAQIALTLRNSPLSNALKPPAGRLSLSTNQSLIFGRRRFIYTYSKNNTQLYAVNNTSNVVSGYNLSGAHLYRNGELVDRDNWKFTDASRTSIVITNATYEAVSGPNFKLMSGSATSSRNRRGYLEVVGAASAPAGPKAKCTVTEIGSLVDGETFTLRFADRIISKVFRRDGKYFYGTTTDEIASSIEQCLVNDSLIVASGMSITVSESTVTFISLDPAASISVTSSNSSFKLSQFVDIGSGARQATLTVVSTDFIDADNFVVSVDGQSPPVRRGWFGTNGFAFASSVLDSILLSLTSDSQFQSSGATASIVGDVLTITSPNAGAQGNTNTYSTSGNSVSISGFSGGLDTATPSFNDVSNIALELIDEQQYDSSGVFHVYCTDNLDLGGSETVYKLVASLPQAPGISIYPFTLNVDDFTSESIDTEDELLIEVIITGKNASGSSETETITITPLNFCEYFDERHGIENELRFVRSKNLYMEITQWVVATANNIGSSELVVLSQATAGSRDLFELSEVRWDGRSIVSKRDLRKFIPSTTFSDGSYFSGEALSTMTALFGMQL